MLRAFSVICLVTACSPAAAPIIVQGERGDPGPAGPTGPRGADGTPGSTGVCDPAACVEAATVAVAHRPPLVGPTGRAVSLDGAFCGVTAETMGLLLEGQSVGYAAAKLRCEATCKSPTAHLCGVDEVLRSIQADLLPLLPGWFASGDDCRSFMSNVQTDEGGIASRTEVARSMCSVRRPVFCCD